MGLDMYLRAKRYISGYEFSGSDEKSTYNILVGELFGVRDHVDPHSPSAEVSFTVAYWRKANAIHAWFVDNVQGGRDECQESFVSRDQLAELRALCQKVIDSTKVEDAPVHVGTSVDATGTHQHYEPGQVIANPEVAESLIPARGGFFFGSTNYDNFYLDELHDTIKQIDRALGLAVDQWDFYYRASW